MSSAVPGVEGLLGAAVTALAGTPRDGQITMTREVAEAIEGERHLLVQAGTGTGKSLAYLVPAVRHAVVENQRVVVSTATLALQRQVMTRDLPLVSDAVAPLLPRAPQFALLKGWQNYLCHHRVDGGYPTDDATLFDLSERPVSAAKLPQGTGDEPERIADQVRRALVWAKETETGDRDDLVPGVTDRAWRQVSVTALECIGPKCALRDKCFPALAREQAKDADVVVTNHAILGLATTGSPGVLPEHDVIVVDEAHELVDRTTAAATVELSRPSLEHVARLARRHGGANTDALENAAAELGALLVDAPEGAMHQGLPEALHQAVAAVRDELRILLTSLRPDDGESGGVGEVDGGAKLAQSAALVAFETAERMAAEDTGDDVLYVTHPRADGGGVSATSQGGTSRLYAAPVDVADKIRSGLLADTTAIFTSATLALGGKFEPVAASLGLGAPDAPGAKWRGLDVGSPFDYRRQGILYVAAHLPAPGIAPATDAQLDEIAELIEAAGGRTLGLFSSRRAADVVAEAMRERLSFPVLAQGDDQLPTLVARFRDDPRACLFGTISLWQGVDVPGPACTLVIIDRIAFPRPDDPVKSARTRAVAAAGGNGFMAVSAAHAALLLAQGAGRLIRSLDDQGVVAVLDPRLMTKRYGAFLTRTMPDFWPTTDPKVVRAALRRLDSANS